MVERIRPRTRPNKTAEPSESNLELFGPPQLLHGEDIEQYEELLGRIRNAVKPLDVIEEMFVHDIMRLKWDILRWQRIKTSCLNEATMKALSEFASTSIGFEFYRSKFQEELAEALVAGFPSDKTEKLARDLAARCADEELMAIDKAQDILSAAELDYETFLNDAKAEKITELLEDYSRGSVEAVEYVNSLLVDRGVTLDDLTTQALGGSGPFRGPSTLDFLERLDHLLNVARISLSSNLHEISRYREELGQALQRSLEDAEGTKLKALEGPSSKKRTVA